MCDKTPFSYTNCQNKFLPREGENPPPTPSPRSVASLPRVGLLKNPGYAMQWTGGLHLQFLYTTRDSHIKDPNLLKSQELPGAPPPGPPANCFAPACTSPIKGPIRAAPDPTRAKARADALAVRFAHTYWFRLCLPPPPLFWKSWIRHC